MPTAVEGFDLSTFRKVENVALVKVNIRLVLVEAASRNAEHLAVW